MELHLEQSSVRVAPVTSVTVAGGLQWGWRISCQVAHCLDSTGSPAGTVGLPTQESQAEVESTVVPSHLQHLPEEQM